MVAAASGARVAGSSGSHDPRWRGRRRGAAEIRVPGKKATRTYYNAARQFRRGPKAKTIFPSPDLNVKRAGDFFNNHSPSHSQSSTAESSTREIFPPPAMVIPDSKLLDLTRRPMNCKNQLQTIVPVAAASTGEFDSTIPRPKMNIQLSPKSTQEVMDILKASGGYSDRNLALKLALKLREEIMKRIKAAGSTADSESDSSSTVVELPQSPKNRAINLYLDFPPRENI